MLEVKSFQGTLSLCGNELIEHIERLAPGRNLESNIPHVTIITRDELNQLTFDIHESQYSISQTSLQFLTLGRVAAVEFLTVSWPQAQIFRRKLGLEAKAFHLALSEDITSVFCEDFTSTLGGYPVFLQTFRNLGEINMDYVLADIQTSWHEKLCREFLHLHVRSYRAYIRFGDVTSDRPHIAMNAYARALNLNPALHPYVVKKLRKLAPLASCGPFTIDGDEMIPKELLVEWPKEAKEAVRDIVTDHQVVTRTHVRYINNEESLPRFFSMVLPYRLAGMSTPRNEADINTLQKVGITKVLTLTQEEPLPRAWFDYKAITNIHVPIPNYGPPTLPEMDFIYSSFTSDVDGFWLVHCGGGKGRAGTVLTCLLAMHGSEDGKPRMEKAQAIALIRHIRPGSIETIQQEEFVGQWMSHRWKSSPNDAVIMEPWSSLAYEVNHAHFPNGITSRNVRVLMLVGLPGSGKSFVATAIAARRSKPTIIISQDDSGSRSACESAMQGTYNDKTLLILDRCNPSSEDRNYWLSLLVKDEAIVCLNFNYDVRLCLQRIANRPNHPTIKIGRGGNAVKQMQEQMQQPTLKEGFGAIYTVCSNNSAREAILLFGGEVEILKFPRTEHLINLGATSVDDIVTEDWGADLWGNLTIEEKIDGANMGFSLNFGRKLLVQNRSHYVNHTTHPQFKPLASWLETHGAMITKLLDRDARFPERFVLYGEWVVATHSIPYATLPDYFLAFDLFDRMTNTFASRSYLSRLLDRSGIQQVPLIAQTQSVSKDQLVVYMKRKSAFYEGNVEGVYVRFEDTQRKWTVRRGKVVRGDFLAGDEHWNKGTMRTNGLVVTRS